MAKTLRQQLGQIKDMLKTKMEELPVLLRFNKGSLRVKSQVAYATERVIISKSSGKIHKVSVLTKKRRQISVLA